MARTCSNCGKQIYPLTRKSGAEQVCPFCWDVVTVESNMEVGDMRKDFQYVENGDRDAEPDLCIGLCVNCKHHSTCAFCGSPQNPKLFCEEFECLGAPCSEPSAEISVVRAEPVTPVIEPVAGEQDAGKYLGLCVNCENRESCCHTIPAGGIWFCEEYR